MLRSSFNRRIVTQEWADRLYFAERALYGAQFDARTPHHPLHRHDPRMPRKPIKVAQ